jgi:hypothetical protein
VLCTCLPPAARTTGAAATRCRGCAFFRRLKRLQCLLKVCSVCPLCLELTQRLVSLRLQSFAEQRPTTQRHTSTCQRRLPCFARHCRRHGRAGQGRAGQGRAGQGRTCLACFASSVAVSFASSFETCVFIRTCFRIASTYVLPRHHSTARHQQCTSHERNDRSLSHSCTKTLPKVEYRQDSTRQTVRQIRRVESNITWMGISDRSILFYSSLF